MSPVIYHNAPKTVDQLMDKCHQIAGKTIADVAIACNYTLPSDLKHNKGLVGQLIEQFLGATAGNVSEPDFPNLAIELKSIPLDHKHQPKESTYICTAPGTIEAANEAWHNCRVRKKISKVLWVPVEADPKILLHKRKIGTPLLWQLDAKLEAVIQKDWEEITYMLATGQALKLTAHYGTYLQIRPKAANSKIITTYLDEFGNHTNIVPKGLYLRTSFTKMILEQGYL